MVNRVTLQPFQPGEPNTKFGETMATRQRTGTLKGKEPERGISDSLS